MTHCKTHSLGKHWGLSENKSGGHYKREHSWGALTYMSTQITGRLLLYMGGLIVSASGELQNAGIPEFSDNL